MNVDESIPLYGDTIKKVKGELKEGERLVLATDPHCPVCEKVLSAFGGELDGVKAVKFNITYPDKTDTSKEADLKRRTYMGLSTLMEKAGIVDKVGQVSFPAILKETDNGGLCLVDPVEGEPAVCIKREKTEEIEE